jgi:hypothetical protein
MQRGESHHCNCWVNDLLPFASSLEEMKRIKEEIKREWEVTDLGEPLKILGIEITLKECSITISQQKYIETILKREGLDQANPISIPLDPNVPLKTNPDGGEGDWSNAYA